MIICLGTTPADQRTMTFASLQLNAVNRAATVARTASGKSINVARVAHTLGAKVTATGFVGGDAASFIRRDLDAAGIRHDFIDVEPNTRLCVTVIDQTTGSATELIEESTPVAPNAWEQLSTALERLLRDSAGEASMLVLSGTLARGAPVDFYARCVAQASAHGVGTIVDAAGEPLRLAIGARPLIVKPNRDELARTLGPDSSMASSTDTSIDAGLCDAMRRVVASGAQWVVVTLGADGAIASDGNGFWRVTVPSIKAVNPIGSGDSFAAGLAVAMTRGEALPAALALAAACGVANAMTPVAGHVRPDGVASLLADLDVKPA
jgi:tagatose 6-phosphate kinase